MMAPKAEIPLYHQGRENNRPSFSRRRRTSTSSRRKSSGNAMCWWMVITFPLLLVAFCLGIFFGAEFGRSSGKDTASHPGVRTYHCVWWIAGGGPGGRYFAHLQQQHSSSSRAHFSVGSLYGPLWIFAAGYFARNLPADV